MSSAHFHTSRIMISVLSQCEVKGHRATITLRFSDQMYGPDDTWVLTFDILEQTKSVSLWLCLEPHATVVLILASLKWAGLQLCPKPHTIITYKQVLQKKKKMLSECKVHPNQCVLF